MTLSSLGLSNRAANALFRAGVKDAETLQSMSALEIARLRGVGDASFAEIAEALNRPDITRRVYSDAPTEQEEQTALFQWASMNYGKYPDLKLMFHIPNEGKRSYISGKRMKDAGLASGVPDIFLPAARGEYHGLFIELKRISKKARVSENQTKWLDALQSAGYAVTVAYGWEEASEAIKKYLQGKDIANDKRGA